MYKKTIILLISLILSASVFGCAKIGKVTGQAVKEVKEMPGEFKDGYKKGRTSNEDSI